MPPLPSNFAYVPSENLPPSRRRSSWIRKERMHQAYINNLTRHPRHTGTDYGFDNFSFYEEQLARWNLSSDLARRLPKVIRNGANDLVYAAATVTTALERMHEIDGEVFERAYPEPTHSHLLRQPADRTPMVVGAECVSPFDSPGPETPTTAATATYAYSKTQLTMPFMQPPANMIGLESPPFTPLHTKGSNTPANGSTGTLPDFQQISARLAPVTPSSSFSSCSSDDTLICNEAAWENYVRAYNAELYYVREAFSRLNGYGEYLNTLRVELEYGLNEYELTNAETGALPEFERWREVYEARLSKVRLELDALKPKSEYDAAPSLSK